MSFYTGCALLTLAGGGLANSLPMRMPFVQQFCFFCKNSKCGQFCKWWIMPDLQTVDVAIFVNGKCGKVCKRYMLPDLKTVDVARFVNCMCCQIR